MDDLIKRADAVEAFEAKITIEDTNDVYKFGAYIQRVMDKIKALPSADTDRPKVIGVDYSPYRIQTTAPSADAVSREVYDTIEPNKIYCSPQLAENVEVVVRCKDCKFWIDNSNCNRWTDDSHDQAYTDANDFCSYGERRKCE